MTTRRKTDRTAEYGMSILGGIDTTFDYIALLDQKL